jgi:hypothetical protein
LTKTQISCLFRGRLDCDAIDAALGQLMSLRAVGCSTEPTRGRPTTLWSVIPEPNQEAQPAQEGA